MANNEQALASLDKYLPHSLEECDHHVRPLPQHVLTSVLHHLALDRWKSKNKITRKNFLTMLSTSHF